MKPVVTISPVLSVSIESIIPSLLACLFLGFACMIPDVAHAVDSTEAHNATVTASNTAIQVSAPYNNDANGNNTLTVEWDIDTGDYSSAWVQSLPHTASPYRGSITGLTEGQAYRVRITFGDIDGVTGSAVQEFRNIVTMNPMIHASATTGSTKWPNGWGVPGGKYGTFTCDTCHTRDATGNIKSIRATITSASYPADILPCESETSRGCSVSFLTTLDTPGTYGDDNGGHLTSNKVCESCHSLTAYHRYNTTGQTSLEHNNRQDCAGCHKHGDGFREPSCNSCHGFPPADNTTMVGFISPSATGSQTAGAHSAHVAKGIACEICHNGSSGSGPTHNSGKIVTLGFLLFDGAYSGGTYNGQTTVDYNTSEPNTVATNTGAMTCNAIYCHGSTMTPNGGSNITPKWDTPATAACGTCHGATADNAPWRGQHRRHTDSWYGYNYPCEYCHKNPSVDASLHVNNRSEIIFSNDPKVAGGIYSGTPAMLDSYGTCTQVYCHSNVQTSPPGGALTYANPNWGVGFGDQACNLCHGGPAEHFDVPVDGNTTGSHPKHAAFGYNCTHCHAAYTDWDPDDPWTTCYMCHPSIHANGVVNVAVPTKYGGSYSGTPPPGDAYGDCTNVYCHSDGAGHFRAVAWGTSLAGCSSCHDIPPSTGAHTLHTAQSLNCSECHYATTTDGITIINPSMHINISVDVSFRLGGSYDKPSRSCSSVSCHVNRTWP